MTKPSSDVVKALARLKAIEEENTVLRSKLNLLSQDGGWRSGSGDGGGGESVRKEEKEVNRLFQQMQEVRCFAEMIPTCTKSC